MKQIHMVLTIIFIGVLTNLNKNKFYTVNKLNHQLLQEEQR